LNRDRIVILSDGEDFIDNETPSVVDKEALRNPSRLNLDNFIMPGMAFMLK